MEHMFKPSRDRGDRGEGGDGGHRGEGGEVVGLMKDSVSSPHSDQPPV